jgi:uncharacterized integral membrane protein
VGYLLAFLAGSAFVVLVLVVDDKLRLRRERERLKRELGGRR